MSGDDNRVQGLAGQDGTKVGWGGPVKRWEVGVVAASLSFLAGVLIALPWDQPPLSDEGLKLGTVSEWFTALATFGALAGVWVAWRGERRRVAALQGDLDRRDRLDGQRDAEIERAAEDRRRAQAEKVWFIEWEIAGDDGGFWRDCLLHNGSGAPIYAATGWRDSGSGAENTPGRFVSSGTSSRVLSAGEQVTHRFVMPNAPPPDDAADDALDQWEPGRFYAVFRDEGGRMWMRAANGALEFLTHDEPEISLRRLVREELHAGPESVAPPNP